MISPTSNPTLFGLPSTGSSSSSSQASANDQLGRDAFLQLLVTQLRNQDPLSPLQPHEFAAQLAQFSSVEQLTKLNDAVTAQSAATHLDTLVGQTSLSASLLGRQVEADGHQVEIGSSGSSSVHIEVGGTGGSAKLTLTDANGQTIATRDLGHVGPGSKDLALPKDLPAGTWNYAVDVTGADGKAAPVTTYTSGTVTAVEFSNGALTLKLGSISIALEDLVRIAPSPSGSTSSSGGGSNTGGTSVIDPGTELGVPNDPSERPRRSSH